MKIFNSQKTTYISLLYFILFSVISLGKIEISKAGLNEIITSTQLINFGLVEISNNSSQSFIIYNLSLVDTVNFNIVLNPSSVFSVEPKSGFLLPNDSLSITTTFKPSNNIGYSDSILIVSEDSTLKIFLFGAGGKLIEAVNPLPNAIGVDRNSEIEIILGFKLNPISLSDSSIKVIGMYRAQYHSETITYDSSSRTLIYKPDRGFLSGELITVIMTSKLEFEFNQPILKSFSWRFRVDVDSSTGSFILVNSASSGINPWRIVVTDLDEDDDLDFVVNNNQEPPGSLTIIKQDSLGVFKIDSAYTTAPFTWSPIAFDFNNDNKIDVGVNGHDFEPITLLRNIGEGKFVFHDNIPCGPMNLAINFGDWNGDGHLDLAKLESASQKRVEFLLNDGEGGFTYYSSSSVGTLAYFIEVNDFNNDGYMDVVCINTNSLTISISVLLNDGNGYFSSNEIPGLGEGAIAMTSGDWDADGDVDLAIVHYYDPGMVSIWLNDGSAFFINSSIIEVGVASKSITSGDWDGDNDLDLATSNTAVSSVSVLMNDGNGNFIEKARYPAGNAPNSVATGDFNNDGDLDLVVVSTNSGLVSVLLNRDFPTAIDIVKDFLPDKFLLLQNYPNPFNPTTKIKFTIPQMDNPLPGGARGGLVTLKVYDVLGNEIAILVNEEKPAGEYEVEFNANRLPSGIYFYQLKAGSYIQTKKMIFLK